CVCAGLPGLREVLSLSSLLSCAPQKEMKRATLKGLLIRAQRSGCRMDTQCWHINLQCPTTQADHTHTHTHTHTQHTQPHTHPPTHPHTHTHTNLPKDHSGMNNNDLILILTSFYFIKIKI